MDCFMLRKRNTAIKGKYSKQISNRLSPQEIMILQMIYQDLSTRNIQNKLSYQHFLDFFDLTGLWGVKLFQQFDEEHLELISFEEFLYGISQTAKAPFDQKIKLLYLFFQEDISRGISFKKFVKMLYNYSKQQLKEFLIEDNINQSQTENSLKNSHTQINICDKVVQLNVESPDKKPTCTFQNAYNQVLSVHEQGTYLEFSDNQLKYKIRYGNMASLIKEFAKKVYQQHGINTQKNQQARLSYQSFCIWIKSHKKLYKSYYSSFHTQIWEVANEQPRYLHQPIDMQYNGRIQCGKLKKDVYGFQVQDIIIFCENKTNKRKPLKIVCLEGLTISDLGNLKIQIAHRSQCYQNFIMIFNKQNEYMEWLKNLSIYQRQSINNNYQIHQVIGTGAYSIVYRCIQKITKRPYALKVMEYQKLTKTAREIISNQSEILKILNHNQILKYIDTVSTKTHQYIITQYIYGEDLYQYVRKRKFLNQFESAFIIGNIMNAVLYLHELQIMHRDLKPENIMVKFKEKKQSEYFQLTTPTIRKGQRIQNIKIIDFGLSNHISNLQKLERKKLAAGTPNYIAPQLLLGQLPLTLKSDVFSIGAILYFLLKGTLPFAELNRQKTILNTVGGIYDITSKHWDNISFQAKDLLTKMLEPEPKQRIQLKQAINHQWFNRFQNKNKQMINTTSPSDTGSQCNRKSQAYLNSQDQKQQPLKNIRKVSNSQSKYKFLPNKKKQ